MHVWVLTTPPSSYHIALHTHTLLLDPLDSELIPLCSLRVLSKNLVKVLLKVSVVLVISIRISKPIHIRIPSGTARSKEF
jgi:hypothetical protein